MHIRTHTNTHTSQTQEGDIFGKKTDFIRRSGDKEAMGKIAKIHHIRVQNCQNKLKSKNKMRGSKDEIRGRNRKRMNFETMVICVI